MAIAFVPSAQFLVLSSAEQQRRVQGSDIPLCFILLRHPQLCISDGSFVISSMPGMDLPLWRWSEVLVLYLTTVAASYFDLHGKGKLVIPNCGSAPFKRARRGTLRIYRNKDKNTPADLLYCFFFTFSWATVVLMFLFSVKIFFKKSEKVNVKNFCKTFAPCYFAKTTFPCFDRSSL